MDSTEKAKSEEIPQPSKSLSDQALWRHKNLNPCSSMTPEKPIDPPRRSRNRSAAFSLKEVRDAARKLQKPEPYLSARPSVPVAYTKEHLASSPVAKSKRRENLSKLPEKYKILDKFFNGLDSSIRLLRMKGSMTTFTNISPKLEYLTDRRFTHSHLAQLKFILPEAIQLKKILVYDERTSCMKPELHIDLDVKAVEASYNVQLGSGHVQLRKIFRSCLVDFYKAHPQGDEIPEEVLPAPFNYSKGSGETNPTRTPDSLMITEIPQRAPSEVSSSSHLSQSFRKSFSQKAKERLTSEEGVVACGQATESPVSRPSFSQLKPQNKCPLPETPSLKKVYSDATRDVERLYHEVSSACLPASPPFATPIKHANSDTKSNSSSATPVQCVSTPAKLMSSTPMLPAPKRCYMTPDDQLTESPNKLVKRPSRNRSLKFDTPDKNAKAEDDAEVQGCPSVADDILDILPEDLLKSIREKEEKALLEQNPAISEAKWRKQMIASLPKLFDMVYFLFQSIGRSVLSKEELIHRLLSSRMDIVDRREIEEQLKLLLGLAPEWIYEKFASSGDCLCGVKKIASPELIRSKLMAQ